VAVARDTTPPALRMTLLLVFLPRLIAEEI
jgi:hypothetical protein